MLETTGLDLVQVYFDQRYHTDNQQQNWQKGVLPVQRERRNILELVVECDID